MQAVPEATISWKYKETDINNGSTLVNDIDMRYYFYIESGIASNRKSELFLSATSVDDNGTFACIAENKAGKARAEFTLHVVVPMPPKPPQVRSFHVSFTFLVLLFWTFLARFSGPPTPTPSRQNSKGAGEPQNPTSNNQIRGLIIYNRYFGLRILRKNTGYL